MFIAFMMLLGIIVWFVCGLITIIVDGFIERKFSEGAGRQYRMQFILLGPVSLLMAIVYLLYQYLSEYLNPNDYSFLDKLWEIGYGKDNNED